jgi:hypothetical protein
MSEIQTDLEAFTVQSDLDGLMGENLGQDIGRPAARAANDVVTSPSGGNSYIELAEHGEHNIKDVRFRDSAKQGFLTTYVRSREFSQDNKNSY